MSNTRLRRTLPVWAPEGTLPAAQTLRQLTFELLHCQGGFLRFALAKNNTHVSRWRLHSWMGRVEQAGPPPPPQTPPPPPSSLSPLPYIQQQSTDFLILLSFFFFFLQLFLMDSTHPLRCPSAGKHPSMYARARAHNYTCPACHNMGCERNHAHFTTSFDDAPKNQQLVWLFKVSGKSVEGPRWITARTNSEIKHFAKKLSLAALLKCIKMLFSAT